MPEEERARLKEQYIKEFRERKRIRRNLESAKKTKAINHALESMVDTLVSTENTTDEFTARLDAETALNEARFEIALENQSTQEGTSSSSTDLDATTPPPDPPTKTIGPNLKANTPEPGA